MYILSWNHSLGQSSFVLATLLSVLLEFVNNTVIVFPLYIRSSVKDNTVCVIINCLTHGQDKKAHSVKIVIQRKVCC